MDRIDICYDGNRFTAPSRDLDSLKREVDDLVGQGGGWIDVSYGDGTAMPSTLYIAPGIPIALITAPLPTAEGPAPAVGGFHAELIDET